MMAADITRHLKREVNEGGVRRRREEEEGGVRTWEDVRQSQARFHGDAANASLLPSSYWSGRCRSW